MIQSLLSFSTGGLFGRGFGDEGSQRVGQNAAMAQPRRLDAGIEATLQRNDGDVAVAAMDPLIVTVLRFGIAALLLSSLALLLRVRWPRGRDLALTTALGFSLTAASS